MVEMLDDCMCRLVIELQILGCFTYGLNKGKKENDMRAIKYFLERCTLSDLSQQANDASDLSLQIAVVKRGCESLGGL